MLRLSSDVEEENVQYDFLGEKGEACVFCLCVTLPTVYLAMNIPSVVHLPAVRHYSNLVVDLVRLHSKSSFLEREHNFEDVAVY